MKNIKDTPRSPKELLDKLQALVAEAEAVLAVPGFEHSPDALRNLRAQFTAARDRFGDYYDTAKDRVVASAKSTDSAIRSNPYQSIAIAVGVGVLVGVLVVGRHKA